MSLLRKPVKPSGYFVYHQFNIEQTLRPAHTVYLCGSQNKHLLFPYTALTDWFVKPRGGVFTARYGLNVYTGWPRRNVPDFGRVFLMLNYADITQNTYVQS